MASIEQVVFGVDPSAATAGRTVLGKSPGLSDEVATEIIRFCELWGNVPPLGLQHSAMLSFPLVASMSSIRGRLYAVIHMSPGTEPLYHAVVMSETDFVQFGGNPFIVKASGVFMESWRSGNVLKRKDISKQRLSQVIASAPSSNEVSVVDEALCHLLGQNYLHLPIEQAFGDSDRLLTLLIACLPTKFKREMRFASFTTSTANSYTLAAVETPGANLAGWRRYLLSSISGQLPSPSADYVKQIRDRLTAGDLDGLAGISAKSASASPGRTGADTGMPRDVLSATCPTPSSRPMTAAMFSSATSRGLAASQVPTSSGRSVRRTRPHRSSRRTQTVSPWSLLILCTVLLVAGFFGWQWASERHLVPEIALPWNLGGEDADADGGATTLLEVVDVGGIYQKQLKRVGRDQESANRRDSRVRRRALAELQAGAAGPLLGQIKVFMKLAGAGIQQGTRPDRETNRLQALSGRGEVLVTELNQLELGYYSLARAVDWKDLVTLPDQQARTRIDSLRAASPTMLDEVADDLGTSTARTELQRACRQVDGMASLLVLFQAPNWTTQWETDLNRAAEHVNPAASRMTRAYRNAAFVLTRLKQAERQAIRDGRQFKPELAEDSWLSEQIAEILPHFKRRVGGFKETEAPWLLSATIAWYTIYESLVVEEDPARAADRLASLGRNPLRKFDPAVYDPQLERLRYEMLARHLRSGSLTDKIAGTYFAGMDSVSTARFAGLLQSDADVQDWADLAADLEKQPFLRGWATYLGREQARREADHLAEFTGEFHRWQAAVGSLRAQARAGIDWTEAWQNVYGQAGELIDRYNGTFSLMSYQTLQLQWVREVRTALTDTLALALTGVTVRLEQDALNAGEDVVVEVRAGGGERVWISDPIPVGPAAPAGSGWVGTGSLAWQLPVSGTDELHLMVRCTRDDREVLSIRYPSLIDGTGPGALARPRPNGEGKVSFRFQPFYWQQLELPTPGGV